MEVEDFVESSRFDRLISVKVDLSHRKSICKVLRKYSAGNYQGSMRMLSNRTTRLSWCRLVTPEVDLLDNLENIPRVTRDVVESTRFDSNRTARHSWCQPVIPEVDLQDTSKIFRKWPRKGLQIFVQSTGFEPLVTVDVDLSYRKSICKTTLLMTSRVDPCDWSRFVYIEYPNLTLKYVLSSFANRLLVRRIYCTYDESCPPVRIVSIRQHLML